jgi:hypothetical protein
MSDKRKTAVEWLIEQLPLIQQEGLRDIWGQAKQIEREQHEDTWFDSHCKSDFTKFNEYYEQTYGEHDS